MPHVTLYPTGWAAGYGAIAAFVRPRDTILIDHLCHPCLQQGAAAATPQINHFIHNNAEDVRARLKSIRAKDARNGIMVITESLFAVEFAVARSGRHPGRLPRERGARCWSTWRTTSAPWGPAAAARWRRRGCSARSTSSWAASPRALPPTAASSPRTRRP